MADSLQEQLRKAGLVKSNARPERTQRPPRARHRQTPSQPQAAAAVAGPAPGSQTNGPVTTATAHSTAAGHAVIAAPAASPPTTSRERARHALAQKSARDRQLNLQREEQAQARARNAEVKQLIETNHLPRGDGDIVHNFILGKKIKRMYVTRAQQEQLIAGTLVIATQKDRHDLVPAAIGAKIQQRDPRCVVLPRTPTAGETDEAYAAYQVPDDLDW